MIVELSGTVLGMELELERILEVDDEGTVVAEGVDDDELTQQVDEQEHVDAGGDEEVLGTKTNVGNAEAESEALELELVEEVELAGVEETVT